MSAPLKHEHDDSHFDAARFWIHTSVVLFYWITPTVLIMIYEFPLFIFHLCFAYHELLVGVTPTAILPQKACLSISTRAFLQTDATLILFTVLNERLGFSLFLLVFRVVDHADTVPLFIHDGFFVECQNVVYNGSSRITRYDNSRTAIFQENLPGLLGLIDDKPNHSILCLAAWNRVSFILLLDKSYIRFLLCIILFSENLSSRRGGPCLFFFKSCINDARPARECATAVGALCQCQLYNIGTDIKTNQKQLCEWCKEKMSLERHVRHVCGPN